MPLAKLRYEVQPDRESLRVCSDCFDPYNVRGDPSVIQTDEDTSLEDPIYDVETPTLFAWGPVGNVSPLRMDVLYFWLGAGS